MNQPSMPGNISRRNVLSLLGASAASLLLAGGPASAIASDNEASLGELAARVGILFGASIGHDMPADYASLYLREARVLTTDTALKFDYLRPSPDRFDFYAADQILRFADKNNLALRGHTLIWNENAPAWLKHRNGREIERIFDAHIETVVSRYNHRLHSWDVVNEPFWPQHGKAGGYRDGPWLAAMGAGYVARAFKRVRSIDKSVGLCLNEAHCELANEWGVGIRPRLLALLDQLLDQGVPITAVGLQGHLAPEWGADDDIFHDYLSQVATRGIDIYISELDISDKTFPADIAARDAAVAARYASFLTRVLSIPQVKIIETWQLADKYSWLRGLRTDARPLLFDDALQPKIARDAVAQAFLNRQL